MYHNCHPITGKEITNEEERHALELKEERLLKILRVGDKVMVKSHFTSRLFLGRRKPKYMRVRWQGYEGVIAEIDETWNIVSVHSEDGIREDCSPLCVEKLIHSKS